MLFLLTLLSVSIGPARIRANVIFPTIGPVTVLAHSPKLDREPRAFLAFQQRPSDILRFQFEMGQDASPQDVTAAPFPVRFAVVKISGFPSPLVVATAGSHGGSDAAFETMIIGETGGSLKELSKRFNTSIQDCICIGSSPQSPEILLFTFSWTDESHYAPHYFTLTTFIWNGSKFVELDARATKRKVRSWRAAAREFGVSCKMDLTELLIPDER